MPLILGRTDGRRRGSLARPSLVLSTRRLGQWVDVKGGEQSVPPPGQNGESQPTLDRLKGARGGEGRWDLHSEEWFVCLFRKRGGGN